MALPGYQLGECLYQGERTQVYRAECIDTRQSAIVKILRNPHPTFKQLVQFRNQYTIARHLQHPHIVRPLALERYGNGYALIMPDEGAVPLLDYWQHSNQMIGEFLAIAIQLAEALHYLNQKHIIHKDIKPANIIIHPETGQIKLIDFSISSLLPKEIQTLQTPNVLEGTLAYLPPEQTGRMNRGIDYRSDFYALGVTFYELLTGKLPFESNDPMELVHCHLAQQPIPPGDWLDKSGIPYPPSLSNIILKLMAKNAEERYQSAWGLKYDLEKCLFQWQNSGELQSFVLGKRDICDRFLIPDKLYGRETEVQALLDAFNRVSQGASELLLVGGYSGVGKTAVVNEVHKPIVAKRGYFIKGKYDQFQRNIPLSAFVQAFRDLMQQLLGENDEQLHQWKTKILAALGNNGQIIIDVIPELENIIGQQSPATALSGVAAQNRFNLLFQKLVRVFANREHPLAIFLDDLQWADSASLKLIQLLMGEQDNQYILAIGAYRDNEVSPTHPLMLMLEDLKKNQVPIAQIILKPLEKIHLDRWIADTLLCDLDLARSLSDLTFQETEGNPFFTSQFIKSLHEDGLITFNLEKQYWQYDFKRTSGFAQGEDVVEFMRRRLLKLPDATQYVLKLAACIGNKFDLEILAIVIEKSPEETAADLWVALQEGLVIPENESYKFYQEHDRKNTDELPSDRKQFPVYKFLHDRVQQAACTLIPTDRQQATYLKIGRLLLAKTPPQNHEEILFDIVNALNQGRQLLTDSEEKQQLCQLNLQAGCKAKASTAYGAACEYLAAGMELLAPDSWETQYELTLALHKERGEVEYLNGDFIAAQQWLDRALPHARTSLEKAEIYNLFIVQYTLQANYPQAIEAGRQALQLLGIDLPLENFEAARDEEIAKVQSILELQTIATLAEMPPMSDPEKKMAVKLLIAIGPPTYRSHQRLWSVICAKATHLCLEYGNAPESGYIYPAYGGLRGYALNNYENTAQLLDITLRVMEQFHNRSAESVAYLMIGSSLRHWSHPLKAASNDYQTSYQIGLESSNLQYAAYAFGHNMYCRFFQGVPLEELASEVGEYLSFSRKQNNQWAIDLLVGGQRIIAELKGIAPNVTETEYLDGCRDRKNWQVICIYRILKTFSLLVADRGHEALEWAQQADAEIVAVAPQGLLPYAQHRIVSALVLADVYFDASVEERTRYWERLQNDYQQLNIWAENCPANFSFARELVGAEIARIQGDPLTAIERYDRAIEAARSQQFWHYIALANELAAKFYRAWGKEKLAHPYLLEAYYSYIRWGAIAKVKNLETRYNSLFATFSSSLPRTQEIKENWGFLGTQTHTSSSSGLTSAFLDLETFLKAARAISAEMHLDRLLKTLMQIAMENAGADRGYLLLHQGKTWQIFSEEGTKMESLSIISPMELSLKAIDYVRHVKKPLILENATSSDFLVGDPYVQHQQPQSLLCLPIFYQNQLTGLLYLENRFTPSVFTRDRVEVLNLLCSQAAISIENARLYEQAQQAFMELQQAQLQIVQSEKMSALGNLVAGVAHEMNNPLGFISASLQQTKPILDDLIEHLRLYQESLLQPNPNIFKHAEKIDLEYNLEELPHMVDSMAVACDRLKNISTSLRIFSRTDKDSKVLFNIHEGLESTILILKHRLKSTENRETIYIIKNYEKIPEIKCFPGQLNQVFMNIFGNAIDALDEVNETNNFVNRQKKLKICIVTQQENGKVIIKIKDNGQGMSAEVKARIFEQGFTTKGVGKGTGLGMAIARQIVEEKHGGQIACHSQLGEGTEFIISLPFG